MVLRLLASGIDTLHVSARGAVRPEVREALEVVKRDAQEADEPVPYEFPLTAQAFMVKPYGLRGYTHWLTSPDFELLLGRGERFPAALVQLHSAYLHSVGAEWAVGMMTQLLDLEVFASPPVVVVSRIDVYADTQGWRPVLADLDRFVCRGRSRRAFVEREQAYASGRRLTGFMFGRDALVARIYDKTAEIGRGGTSWLPDLWGERDEGEPVWRLELQVRRKVLAEFGLRSVAEVLSAVQDLWRYGTMEWLTLRVPNGHRAQRRWPVDPAWQEVQAVRIAPEACGVVRRRLVQAAEARVVQGLQGYLSSWAALRDRHELRATMEAAAPIVERYLASRGRTFAAEVRRKQARLMSVTAFLDPVTQGSRPTPAGRGPGARSASGAGVSAASPGSSMAEGDHEAGG